MTVGERIRAAREKLQMSQDDLGREVGVSRTTIDNWEKGKHRVPDKNVPALRRVLSLTKADFNPYGPGLSRPDVAEPYVPLILLQWSDLKRIVRGKLDMVAAGKRKYIEADPEIPTGSFALKVEDNSMEPVFYVGEVFIVDPKTVAREDDHVIVRLLSTPLEHLLRRYVPRRNGSFDAQAENPDYPTITVNSATPGEIIGVVVEHRKRRRDE